LFAEQFLVSASTEKEDFFGVSFLYLINADIEIMTSEKEGYQGRKENPETVLPIPVTGVLCF
jgi:hypothetical protein